LSPYAVSDLYPCIQGEGCQTGTPMALLRLQGCRVGCPWCDTKQTWLMAEEHQRPTLEEALGDGPEWCHVQAS
jgi:7-carboxy-7-deazaguanine synthase